jgi:hypothetical protein
MSTDDDLIDRADTLIRRYRSFVARPSAAPPAVENCEDIPLLTDVVAEHTRQPHNPHEALDSLKKDLENEIATLQKRLLELIDGTRQKL